jgi:hypothetical protein
LGVNCPPPEMTLLHIYIYRWLSYVPVSYLLAWMLSTFEMCMVSLFSANSNLFCKPPTVKVKKILLQLHWCQRFGARMARICKYGVFRFWRKNRILEVIFFLFKNQKSKQEIQVRSLLLLNSSMSRLIVT